MTRFFMPADTTPNPTVAEVARHFRAGTGPEWLLRVTSEDVRAACRLRGIQITENRLPARYASDVYFGLRELMA